MYTPQPIPSSTAHLLCRYPVLIVPIIIGITFIPVGNDCCQPAMISFVFWNGDDSAYECGMPILEKYAYKGSVFVSTSQIGSPGYLTNGHLQVLNGYNWEIGTHGIDLGSVAENEPLEAKIALQSLSISPLIFATKAVNEDVRLNYMGNLRIDHRGINSIPVEDRYAVKTIEVVRATTPEEIKEWIDTAANEQKWLVLVFHELDKPGDLSWTSADFESIVAYARSKEAYQVNLSA